MNYIVFGLGFLLAGAGCLSVFAGYDIIEVERGWTEVIAGVTAISGGVITIALSLVSHRLKLLSDLYASAQPLQAPSVVLADEPYVEPAEAPAAAALPPVAAPALASPAPSMDMGRIAPSPAFASGSPLQSGFIRARSGQTSDRAVLQPEFETDEKPIPVFSQPAPTHPLTPPEPVAEEPAKVSQPMTASVAREVPEDVLLPLLHELDIPELKPEPAASAVQAADLSHAASQHDDTAINVDLDELEHRAFGLQEQEPEPEPETVVAAAPAQPSSSLSIDAMWQRVSGEIEKPIFPAYTYKSPIRKAADAPAPDVPKTEPAPVDMAPVAAVPFAAEEIPANPAHLDSVIHSDQMDAEAQEKMLHDALMADLGLDDLEPQPSETATHIADHHYAPGHDHAYQSEPATGIFEKPMAPPPAPPPPKPSMIGRYEAEGTAYLMFDDGSIEAQSEAGIFHFASMAELKAFIEGKQVAET